MLRAEMQHLDQGAPIVGMPSYLVQFVSTDEDFQLVPTSFLLQEDTGIRCVKAPCPSTRATKFVITDKQSVGCGSEEYTALNTAVTNGPDESGETKYEIIRVVDHTNRTCRDFRPFKWEVEIEAANGARQSLQGNPNPINLFSTFKGFKKGY